MIVIRFQRRGKKNRPFFKIVLAEKTSPPKGKFLEILGSYDPFSKERMINADRVHYWMERGAGVSASVHNLFVRAGVVKGEKIPVHGVRTKGQAAESPASPVQKIQSPEKESSESPLSPLESSPPGGEQPSVEGSNEEKT